jgi:hypothetical protein
VSRALLLVAALLTQAAVPAEFREAAWSAVQPALPYPAATERNEPVDGSDRARWVVRRVPAAEGALIVEVLANPLNREAQNTAVQDMAAIQREVVAAERRAQLEFDRALGEVRETGQPVSVRGVTLSDEGLAGDRADAESRLTVEILMPGSEHTLSIASADAPRFAATTPGAAWVIKTPPRSLPGPDGRTHYYAAEALVFFGAAKPAIGEKSAQVFTVRATPRDGASSFTLVTIRGNHDLVDDVLARADWSSLTKAVTQQEASSVRVPGPSDTSRDREKFR